MRPHVPSLAFVLGAVSLAEAAVFDRRQEAPASSVNLADGFMSVINRIGAAQTITETLRQTITVGAGGDAGAGTNTNATAAVTVTVTAAASTVTVCPGQANGAVDGAAGGESASAASGGAANSAPPSTLVIPSGGIGVVVVSVPEAARKTSLVVDQPGASESAGSQTTASGEVVSQSAAPQLSASETALSGTTASETAASETTASETTASETTASEQPADTSSLVPLPTQGEANQPGLTDTPSATSLAPLPVAADPTSDPIASPPESVSDSSTIAPSPSATSSDTTIATDSATLSDASSVTTSATVSDDLSATTSATASDTTIGPLPGLASSLSDTLSLSPTGSAPPMIPNGAFGGSVGLIPMASVEDMPATPTPTTPGVANGAGIFPTINVSGLTLSSQLNLGNLAQRTSTARP
ncbi:hypothetical protein N658DRAFT_486707 [Parathielavia hyrcaniae]|uniref:Uncharacterized protein n=1 Tax=Parathielavia hyrcaniae TaxID=113614 RepID=A0AAN6T1J8_9PEZI|nr:hypothetical protein N658DRAFT_486707 [Parathielavia hyrcaniae]